MYPFAFLEKRRSRSKDKKLTHLVKVEEDDDEVEILMEPPLEKNCNEILDNHRIKQSNTPEKSILNSYEDESEEDDCIGTNNPKEGSTKCIESDEPSIFKSSFHPLDTKEISIVEFALSRKHCNKILVEHPKLGENITGDLLQVLRPNVWLNDKFINSYLVMLKEREKEDPERHLKCHFFNTFFYSLLARDLNANGFGPLLKQTQKLDYKLLYCDKIFVPINKNQNHWSVVLVDVKRKKMQYLDSYLRENEEDEMQAITIMENTARYMREEAKENSNIDFPIDWWTMEIQENTPQQTTMNDCGVFMLKFVDFHSKDLVISFKQDNIPLFRKRMVLELLNIPGCSYKADEVKK